MKLSLLPGARTSSAKVLAFTLSTLVLNSVPVNYPAYGAEPEEPAAFFLQAVPASHNGASALTYHDIPINEADIRNKEPLVNLSDYGIAGEAYYARTDGLNAPYHACICQDDSAQRLRKTLALKLQKINKSLAALGLELYVFDAYRPVSCQRRLWDYFLAEARRILVAADPSKLGEYAGKYCSNPTFYDKANYRTWPTHLTGGAVDLTLRRKKTGELLYMGSIFDDASDLSHTAHFEEKSCPAWPESRKGSTEQAAATECPSGSSQDRRAVSDIEAMKNRRLLYWVMQKEGFASYTNEWWHFDFGNQMWVQNRQERKDEQERPAQTAFYGAV